MSPPFSHLSHISPACTILSPQYHPAGFNVLQSLEHAYPAAIAVDIDIFDGALPVPRSHSSYCPYVFGLATSPSPQ